MWTNLLENPRSLELFDQEPSLEAVTLSKLLMDYDGPTITMSIDLREYPARPPARWKMLQHNAVGIEVQAMGVEHVRILGWTTENEVSISVDRSPEGGLRIQAVGGATDIELRCGWLRISKITPYCRAA